MEILVGPEPAEPPHLILFQVKIDHILYQTFCRTPNVQQNLTLGSREAQKVCKVGFFWHFFFRYVENNCQSIHFRRKILST